MANLTDLPNLGPMLAENLRRAGRRGRAQVTASARA